MQTLQPRTARGYTLPLALVALVIALSLLRELHGTSVHLLRTWRLEAAGEALQLAFSQAIAAASLSPGPCQQQPIQGPLGDAAALLCPERPSGLSSVPPLPLAPGRIDYEQVFAIAQPCPGTLSTVRAQRFVSPQSHHTCSVAGAARSPLVVLENLAAQDVILAAQEESPSNTIASLGFVTVRGVLAATRPLVILAGGDVSIDAIQAAGREPVPVTVISARGAVEVRAARGVSLVVVGSGSLQAPLSPLPPLPFPFPPTRPYRLVGAALLDRNGA